MTKHAIKQAPLSLVLIIFVLSVIALCLPGRAYASFSTGKNMASCKSNLAKENLTDIRDKKRDSMRKREKVLKTINEELINKTQNNIKKYNATKPKYDEYKLKLEESGNNTLGDVYYAQQPAITNQQLEKVDYYSTAVDDDDTVPEFTLGDVPNPTLEQKDLDALKNTITRAKALVDAGVNATNKKTDVTSKTQLIDAICATVHGTNIYSEILPTSQKLYSLSRIDVLKLKNWQNMAIAQYANDTSASKAKLDSNFWNGLSKSDIEAGYRNAKDYKAELDKLQGKAVSADYTKKNVYKAVKSDITKVSRKVQDQNKLRDKQKKATNKRVKKK